MLAHSVIIAHRQMLSTSAHACMHVMTVVAYWHVVADKVPVALIGIELD